MMTNQNLKNDDNSQRTRATLLRGLQAGDEDRWREFDRSYGPLIRGFALKAGLTETEADEVVQETCIGVARNIGQFRYDPQRCRFKTWLLNLALWRVNNQFTKRQRWDDRVHTRSPVLPGRRPVLAETDERTATIERLPLPADQSLEIKWEEEWRSHLLRLAMERVRSITSVTQFQIFDLTALKEWPAAAVARSLGVTLASVYLAKHRVSSALKREIKRLEKQLEKQMDCGF